MKTFIIGTIFGILISTVGIAGIAKIMDNGVTKVQQVSREAAN